MASFSYEPTATGGMLPSPWFTHHTWAIEVLNNATYGYFVHSGHSWAELRYDVETDTLDQYCEAEVNLAGGTWVNGIGPAVRLVTNSDGTWTGYAVHCTHYNGKFYWEIVRNDVAVVGPTNLAALDATATSGAPILVRVEVEGSVVRAFINGTQVGTYTDPTPITTSKYTGLSVHDTAGGFYSFAAGDLGGAVDTRKMNVWTGSAWTPATVKVWTGSAWTTAVPKAWNGSAWV